MGLIESGNEAQTSLVGSPPGIIDISAPGSNARALLGCRQRKFAEFYNSPTKQISTKDSVTTFYRRTKSIILCAKIYC